MKKKLLSLVLAGAMVATTSVSAFATPNVTGSDNIDGNAEIGITGEVMSDTGEKPAGRFNVTVPTATSFTVDKEGHFIAPERISIQNDGLQDIDVYADKFVDTKPTEGIKVVAESELKSKNRTYISLSVTGKSNAVYLKSEDTTSGTNKGIYTTSALTSAASAEQLKLTSISAGQSGYLTLDGKAGEKNKATGDSDEANQVNEGVSNSFTLTLKIKKATKN